jgi:hypothetical protein
MTGNTPSFQVGLSDMKSGWEGVRTDCKSGLCAAV